MSVLIAIIAHGPQGQVGFAETPDSPLGFLCTHISQESK